MNQVMHTMRTLFLLATAFLLVTAICAARAAETPAGKSVPLVFIANQGQAPAAVRFMVKGSGVTAFFSPREARFRVGDASVRLQFVGANPSVEVAGLEPQPGRANFLVGPQEEWRLGVPLFGAVVYRELYPGIDMVYGGSRRSLKSEFVVAPGADPARIQVRYLGAGELRIDESGALVIPIGGPIGGAGNHERHGLREQAPVVYQERDGGRVAVDGRFTLGAGGVVGFIVNDYDVSRPLVIDPVLSYSTLLGGASSDAATALAV